MESCGKIAPKSEPISVESSQGLKSLIVKFDDPRSAETAARAILAGESAVVPTETIYGLTCESLNERAVARLYQIKGRDLSKPSAVFLGDPGDITTVAEITSKMAEKVIQQFLPGPLTVVLRSKLHSLAGVVGQDGKIGIRISSHPFIQSLCRILKSPLIATSANISGVADCRTAAEVLAAFDGVVSVIVLEETALTQCSTTVVDLTGDRPVLLRDGTIPFSEVLNCAEGIL